MAMHVQNSAGGPAFALDDMQRLRRFLILGSESSTYYASARDLTIENALCVRRLLADGRAPELVDVVKEISVEGRASKQEPTMFALAMAARHVEEALGDSTPRQAAKLAFMALQDICRIPTHLMMFLTFMEKLGESTGWGRMARRSISNWYTDKDASRLAFMCTKYPSREGWSHRDVLRLAHPRTRDAGQQLVFRYLTHKMEGARELYQGMSERDQQEVTAIMALLNAVEVTRGADEVSEDLIELVGKHKLAREHMSTKLLDSKVMWQGLLPQMPMTAML
jgi:60 kDa SS-A/Ro ribonucleoprotein